MIKPSMVIYQGSLRDSERAIVEGYLDIMFGSPALVCPCGTTNVLISAEQDGLFSARIIRFEFRCDCGRVNEGRELPVHRGYGRRIEQKSGSDYRPLPGVSSSIM